jgi:hypothetical protein
MEWYSVSLAELRVTDCSARLHETFTLGAGASFVKLTLVEVEELGQSLSRQAFSLRFLGPAQPVLPQATYRLDHPALGALEIFLVPLGPKSGGMRYEAVFT